MKKQGHGYFPDECWELIFQKLRDDDERDLNPISLVSKRFLSISNWVKLSLHLNDLTVLPLLPNLLRRFQHIKTIDIHDDMEGVLHQISQSGLLNLQAIRFLSESETPRDGFRALALNKNIKKSLKVLDCSGLMYMEDNDLVLIANLFPRLEELRISAGDYMSDDEVVAHMTDDGVVALASKLKELKKIGFEGNTRFITDKSLISLSTNCVKLRKISLDIFNSAQQYVNVTEDGIDFVVRHCPNLTSLLLRSRLQTSAFSFTVGNPFTNARNLHSLTQEFITERRLCLVAKSHPPLKKLKLMGFTGQYSEIHGALKLLLKACQLTLEELTLTAWILKDTDVADLVPYLSHLTSIDLHEHFHLTSSTFYVLTKYCPSLQKLMMGLMGQWEERVMDDAFSLDYSHRNYCMQHLDICENMWLNDGTLKNFVCVCPNLQFLCVRDCLRLTSIGIGEVLRRCPKITQLNINGLCVSDISGRDSDHSVLNLKTLHAYGTEIDDKGMAIIGNRCRNLQYLDVGYCKQVTDKGVMDVVRNCKTLRDISLRACEKVSPDILHQMMLSRPSLRSINPPCFDDLSEQLKSLLLSFGCQVGVSSTQFGCSHQK